MFENLKIKIINNPYNFNLSDLVVLGGRLNNAKRNFLFISKVLGKHIPVKPNVMKAIGYLLANEIYPENNINVELLRDYIINKDGNENAVKAELSKKITVNKDTLIIGFAETATALGMSLASSLNNIFYVNTTREELIDEKSVFDFEEEHSHAINHKCYLKDINKFKNAKRIILVDDEITTGKTMLNLIEELKKVSPDKEYIVVSILDFRNDEYRQKYNEFINKNKINIRTVSLISANISFVTDTILNDNCNKIIDETISPININCFEKCIYKHKYSGDTAYITHSGRFGCDSFNIDLIEEKAKTIANEIDKLVNENDKVLVLGHGEDMYIPSRIASYMKSKPLFKTTTRSPILINEKETYPIKDRYSFKYKDVTYYLYNKEIIEEEYDKVFFITEEKVPFKLTENMIRVNI